MTTVTVTTSDTVSAIQSKVNSLLSGDTITFKAGTYDFHGVTVTGKSGVTFDTSGSVIITNAPGAGSAGAFNFAGKTDWIVDGFTFNGSLVDADTASRWKVADCVFNDQA